MNSLTDHQTTKQLCRIFHLGLETGEAQVIENLFRSDPELGLRYVYGPGNGKDEVDLVFVNADSLEAGDAFAELRRQRPEILAIMVTEEDREFDEFRVIRKPLNFRNFVAILDAITSTDVREIKNDCASNVVRILVVDDSLPARQFMKLKLDALSVEAGIPVHVDMADCGEKALQIVRRHGYDLAFVDVVMPGMDGYEVCRQLKQIAPLRVAMLTGRAAPVDFTRGRSAGCDNYLPKPANDSDLRTILRLTSLKKMAAPRKSGA